MQLTIEVPDDWCKIARSWCVNRTIKSAMLGAEGFKTDDEQLQDRVDNACMEMEDTLTPVIDTVFRSINEALWKKDNEAEAKTGSGG